MYKGLVSVWDGKDHKKYQVSNGEVLYDLNVLRGNILDIKNIGKIVVTSSVLHIINGVYDTQIHGYLTV